MDLDEALRRCDVAATNLSRLEDVWSRLEHLRDGQGQVDGPREYAKLVRAFHALAGALPPIDGFSIDEHPMDLTDDVVRALSDVRAHWQPPPVDLLIIATSGRFTGDAVKTIQAHNERGERPRIDWSAESRLESLLATRTRLVTELGLRPST